MESLKKTGQQNVFQKLIEERNKITIPKMHRRLLIADYFRRSNIFCMAALFAALIAIAFGGTYVFYFQNSTDPRANEENLIQQKLTKYVISDRKQDYFK